MALSGLRRRSSQGLLRIGLCALLLVSLILLSEATQNSTRFGNLYAWLLLINSVGLVVLLLLIVGNLWLLLRQHRRGQAGSRLTVRLVAMLIVLSVVPVSVVYYFSMQFLRGGIDSWFDVRVEGALQDALTLSQASLDLRMRELLKRMEESARALENVPDSAAPGLLGDLRDPTGASELALLGSNGRVIGYSSQETSGILPELPEANLLLQLRQGRSYVGLDPGARGELHVRVLVPVGGGDAAGNGRVLQALFPISSRLSDLADSVQAAYADYRELAFLREPLKRSFVLTLSLVLLVSILFAVWTAFYLARRLVAPIRELAEGTRALAAGDYGTQLAPAGRDELGFLVQSFNDMSRRIAQTREAAKRGQVQVESQRAYLETVLARLSSGVLTLDRERNLRTYNQAAADLLEAPLQLVIGSPLASVLAHAAHLEPLVEALQSHLSADVPEWREELALEGPDGRRMLVVSVARLPGGQGSGGYVIVFDDLTALLQAQRDAAWGEVARRLAHEIKNPLTPIQLSAERIRHRYLERMEGKDAEVLERATRTIVQQVDAMKEMVNAFSDYARPPKLQLQPLDLNQLVHEVVELYRASPEQLAFRLDLESTLPALQADPGRLRQLLHNLIKNAQEACAGGDGGAEVEILTRLTRGRRSQWAELVISDNGPGFADDMLNQLFEPYATSKPRGTGLGLAIVKKIVEEHNGTITARNSARGAQLIVRMPIKSPTPSPQEAFAVVNKETKP